MSPPHRSPRPLRLALLAVALAAGACGDDDDGDHGSSGPHDHAGMEHGNGQPGVIPSEANAGAGAAVSAGADGYEWHLPAWFPKPTVPEDNPMSEVKVELGRHLFYDKQLSENRTQACAGCHLQELAFTDGKVTAVGSTGEDHPRNAMALANVAYSATLTWANPILFHLEQQAIVPIFGAEPVELGMRGREDELVARLRATRRYQQLFPSAFPDDPDPFSIANLVRALSTFERTVISADSPYDRYVYRGQQDALGGAAKRGLELFNSERLECFHCHNGFNLQDSINYQGKGPLELRYHNTGLYNIDGRGAYPAPNTGIHEITGKPEDMGRFRVPSLRNVAVTAPYMHDGSMATLQDVLAHYAAGGRRIETAPNRGDGNKSPLKSSLIGGFEITEQERADVIAFLESLTDDGFLSDPAFSDPWNDPCSLCEPAP